MVQVQNINQTYLLLFGQFGRLVDFDTIIATAALCKKNDTPVNFILCGSGEYLEKYKTIVNEKQLDNVFLPGWVNQDDIQDVGYISDLGLMSYYDDKNFNMQMTNKFSEYLSLGLGILLQPTGVMLDVIKRIVVVCISRMRRNYILYLILLLLILKT